LAFVVVYLPLLAVAEQVADHDALEPFAAGMGADGIG
jgi:hypothetical protein